MQGLVTVFGGSGFVGAQVVELVDALASGASVRKDVKVRVLSWAPVIPRFNSGLFCRQACRQGCRRLIPKPLHPAALLLDSSL